MIQWNQKKVLVIGTGISGIGSAKVLHRYGADVILYDGNTNIEVEKVHEKLPEIPNLKIIIGKLTEEQMELVNLVVLSPGVPVDSDLVNNFVKRNITVWGEVELAYQIGKGDVIAITGTNGKTTTTSLTGEIVGTFYESCFVVGNIGNPYTEAAVKMKEDTVTIAEISSFQLETIDTFHPKISAILNITPDHLDRHHTMDNYVMTKQKITHNQIDTDVCVLNYEDKYAQTFAKTCKPRVVFFSTKHQLYNGYYLQGENIIKAIDGKLQQLMSIHDMILLGTHNVENVMAAIAITDEYGIPMSHILNTVKSFKGVEHRIEFVTTKKGVNYYNDSKGTNPDAAIKGIRAMNRKTILIGGGYDKSSSYDEWIESFDGKVKHLVLLGQTRNKIAQCAKKHGFHDVTLVDTLEEAVTFCKNNAKEGDAVLLSPACASWGMFPNYEIRGKIFKELVKSLEE